MKILITILVLVFAVSLVVESADNANASIPTNSSSPNATNQTNNAIVAFPNTTALNASTAVVTHQTEPPPTSRTPSPDGAKFRPKLEDSGLFHALAKGKAVDKGFYSFLAMFAKDENLMRRRKRESSEVFTLDRILCSGTVMNRLWILTSAMPIGKEVPDQIIAIIQREIEIPFVKKKNALFKIANVVLSPDYSNPNISTMALVKTTKPMDFGRELLAPEFLKVHKSEYANCKLIAWTLDPNPVNEKKNHYVFFRSIIPFVVGNNGTCTGKFCALSQVGVSNKSRICSLNKGAPLICDLTLWAIMAEKSDGSNLECVLNKSAGDYKALSVTDNSSAIRSLEKWLHETISTPPNEKDSSKVQDGECKQGKPLYYSECGVSRADNINFIEFLPLAVTLVATILYCCLNFK